MTPPPLFVPRGLEIGLDVAPGGSGPLARIPDPGRVVLHPASRPADAGVDRARFVDDLRRLPTLPAWGLGPGHRSPTCTAATWTIGKAIAAIFEAYAAKERKLRWGDKTPMYMRHLPLLERSSLPRSTST